MTGGEPSQERGLGDLLSQLQAAQADLEAQSAAVDAAVVEGSSAGGAVVVRLTGALEAESVHIDASLADLADPSLLEDAVLAALRDALGQVVELRVVSAGRGRGTLRCWDGPRTRSSAISTWAVCWVASTSAASMANLGMDFGALGGYAEDDEVEDEEDADDEVEDEPEA